jgi:hypothetical protein
VHDRGLILALTGMCEHVHDYQEVHIDITVPPISRIPRRVGTSGLMYYMATIWRASVHVAGLFNNFIAKVEGSSD